MSGRSAFARLLDVAVDQHGFITPATASEIGVDPARLPVMVARGQLARWGRGVYRIPQLPLGKYDEFAGAVMRVGHGAVVSHESADYLHGATAVRPETIDVTVPVSARVRRVGLEGIRVWREDLAHDRITLIEGIPTTAPSPDAPSQPPRLVVINGKVLYDGRSLVAWASHVADRIMERCDARRVVLHGSVARGDDGPDSDIDLLVVMPFAGRRHDATVRIMKELRDLPVPVDITVVDPARLDEEARIPGIVRTAIREGRILASV